MNAGGLSPWWTVPPAFFEEGRPIERDPSSGMSSVNLILSGSEAQHVC